LGAAPAEGVVTAAEHRKAAEKHLGYAANVGDMATASHYLLWSIAHALLAIEAQTPALEDRE